MTDDRFWQFVNTDGPIPESDPSLGPCHLWTGAGTRNGYGHLRRNGKFPLAHVYAWQLANGDIPEGFDVDHRCHNRRCVNIEHLRLLNHYENMDARQNHVTITTQRANGSADTETAGKRVVGRPFAPGNMANPYGRPRKGATVLDEAKRQMYAHRRGEPTNAQLAAAAHVERMMRLDQTGNRAFDTWLAYESGLPKQAFEMTIEQPAVLGFLTRQAARGIVDGEARLLSESRQTHEDERETHG